LTGIAILAVILGGTAPAQAQRATEEWNALQDVNRTEDPKARLQVIETFLKTYPDSKYRVYVYPNMMETAYSVQNYAKAMEAADAFLAMDRQQVLAIFRESAPNLEEAALDPTYYRFYMLYTLSFLQSFRENGPKADEIARKAGERAAKALELHDRLWAAAQPPQGVTPEQFQQMKSQEENSIHTALAFVAYRHKEYPRAAKEYAWLLERAPEDARLNYQVARVLLQQNPPDYQRGFWYLGRAISLNIPKSDEVKDFLRKSLAAYQQVPPECLNDQVNDLVAESATAVKPTAGWRLASAEQVNSLREELSVKRIFDDLRAGGDSAHMMYLASCGTVIGLGEEGPELAVMILEVNQTPGNLVTLRAAAGQEAVDAKVANVEVKVEGPEEARSLKVDDVVRVSGKIVGYQPEPFLLKLTDGRVNPEDIPKARR
jgi:tetratricopeptide (TPR) repeat protein